MTWTEGPCLALDCETTGVDPFTDRIVELASVLVWPDGSTTNAWSTIVDPGVDIPEGAEKVHGISTSRARREGVHPTEALESIAEKLFHHGPSRPIVAFNARYDWSMILAEVDRHNVAEFPCFSTILCPFLIDKQMIAEEKYRKGSRKLSAVATHYGVEFNEAEAHGALYDATAAGKLMWRMLAKYPAIGERSLASMWLLQARAHEQWRVGFEDFKRKTDPGVVIAGGWPVANARET